MLQSREHFGERIGIAGNVELDPGRLTQQQPGLPGRLFVQRLQHGDVICGIGSRDGADVPRLERLAIPGHQPRSLLRGLALGQLLAQSVLPGPRRFQQACLDLRGGLFDFGARPRAHQKMDAGEAIAHELHLTLDAVGIKDLLQNFLHALAHLPAIAIAWHVDQTGIEATVAVATHQELELLAVAQGTDRQRHFVEFALPALKQFITRKRLDDVAQTLGRVAVAGQPGLGDHIVQLAPHNRNTAGWADIHIGREQPQEPICPDHLATLVVVLERDRVHVIGVMNMRAGRRLGNHDQAR